MNQLQDLCGATLTRREKDQHCHGGLQLPVGDFSGALRSCSFEAELAAHPALGAPFSLAVPNNCSTSSVVNTRARRGALVDALPPRLVTRTASMHRHQEGPGQTGRHRRQTPQGRSQGHRLSCTAASKTRGAQNRRERGPQLPSTAAGACCSTSSFLPVTRSWM